MLHVPPRHQSRCSLGVPVKRGNRNTGRGFPSITPSLRVAFFFFFCHPSYLLLLPRSFSLLRFTPQKPTPLNLPVCYALIVYPCYTLTIPLGFLHSSFFSLFSCVSRKKTHFLCIFVFFSFLFAYLAKKHYLCTRNDATLHYTAQNAARYIVIDTEL